MQKDDKDKVERRVATRRTKPDSVYSGPERRKSERRNFGTDDPKS